MFKNFRNDIDFEKNYVLIRIGKASKVRVLPLKENLLSLINSV